MPASERRALPAVHLIITMIKWIRTSRLSIKNSLSALIRGLRTTRLAIFPPHASHHLPSALDQIAWSHSHNLFKRAHNLLRSRGPNRRFPISDLLWQRRIRPCQPRDGARSRPGFGLQPNPRLVVDRMVLVVGLLVARVVLDRTRFISSSSLLPLEPRVE